MKNALIGLLTLALLGAAPLVSAKDEKSPMDEILAKHRDAIGAAPARAAVKTRVAEGTSHYTLRIGGTASLDGKAALLSEGGKIRVLLRYTDPSYPGENYVTNGDQIQVFNRPRSGLGELVYLQPALLCDGLLGGVLTTAWPFLKEDMKRVKLSYSGLKKIDDRMLHEVKFTPKKKSDLDIRLYFDPENYRHVLSIYRMEINPRMLRSDTSGDRMDYPNLYNQNNLPGGTSTGQTQTADATYPQQPGRSTSQSVDVQNSQQQVTRYRLEERFDEFRAVDGVTLPASWKIKLTMEGYQTATIDWDVKFDKLENNIGLDPRNFPIK